MSARMELQDFFKRPASDHLENGAGYTKHSMYPPTQSYPDILNDPETPISVVEIYFLLRDNEFHTLHYIVEKVLGNKFKAEDIGAAMKIYMES